MKTLIDLFYETYRPRQRRYHLRYHMTEQKECTIRIYQNEKKIIEVTEEDRSTAFHKATKELIRKFPAQKGETNGKSRF